MLRTREELRRFTARLRNASEEEKARIARELHDDLGQQLSALKMDLAALELTLTRDGNGNHPVQLQRMRRIVDSTLASVRRIAADLRPAMLDDLGLVPAIEWLTNDFANRHGIDIVRRIQPGNAVFSKDGATALFRIAQEALNNVARHAQASAVELDLTADAPRCMLRIADNGRGICRHAAMKRAPARSFGLIDVRERAHRLGGSVRVESAENQGFAITVTFPFRSVQQQESDS
jgi:signal transduction histidine kinase